jgi:hypothetical protein
MKATLVPLLLSLLTATPLLTAWPINDVCPVDGKSARPIYRVKSPQGFIAFCCSDCMSAFERSPSKYTVEKKEP